MRQYDSGKTIKVAIADDHALFRAGVKTALSVKKRCGTDCRGRQWHAAH